MSKLIKFELIVKCGLSPMLFKWLEVWAQICRFLSWMDGLWCHTTPLHTPCCYHILTWFCQLNMARRPPGQWFSARVTFLPRNILAMSGDITACMEGGGECCCYLVNKNQGCSQTSHKAQMTPHHQEWSSQNISKCRCGETPLWGKAPAPNCSALFRPHISNLRPHSLNAFSICGTRQLPVFILSHLCGSCARFL